MKRPAAEAVQNNAQLMMSCGCTVQAYVEPAAARQYTARKLPVVAMKCVDHGAVRLTGYRPYTAGGK